ncbi:Mycothiol acetyltransferase [Streptomyces sp. RB5]|uniref:Mycothiol acetyltransferase n=1 Tax=Streptomyces smaragdinus TaxID=2585196 RepID=A0A7K0C9P0_9ACTN|nr:GNAT family N-acetyltransferase [Streptomyces smaragdinus]MQY10103.1 Mycothiol acetyltransferase [Streptomyces smaragdinus]
MSTDVRPATLRDAQLICDLLNEIDLAEIGRAETDLPYVTTGLEHPDADLPHNSWLAFEDDRLVAYGLLWDDSKGERIDIDHYVLPGRDETAVLLFNLMEARATRVAAANGADRAVVHMQLNTRPTLDTALIEARGWQTVRRYHVLTKPVSPAGDPPPDAPPGVTVRDCAAPEDRRRLHELRQRAMAHHFDFQPQTYEKWAEDPGVASLDWSLCWIASVDGTDAGILLGRNDREAMGWVSTLAVLEEARGKGLGGHLLRRAFAAFAGRGRDSVGLGVDTRNASGALGLYERHGMGLHFAVDTWEVTIPVPAV